MNKFILISLFLVVLIPISQAHGDLHARIQLVSEEIKTHPDSAHLYLKRGQLYLQHEEFKKSLEDFKKCKTLGHKDWWLDYNMATAFAKTKDFDKALELIDQCLTENQKNVKVLRLKGQCLFDIKKYGEAAICYEHIIDYADKTIPENYFEASSAWENSSDSNATCKAIEAIERGIQNIGPINTFYMRLVEITLNKKDYSSALFYQTQIISLSNRKEKTYYDRALIHIMDDNAIDAKKDLKLAQASIDGLNARLKRSKPIQELLQLIQSTKSSLLDNNTKS